MVHKTQAESLTLLTERPSILPLSTLTFTYQRINDRFHTQNTRSLKTIAMSRDKKKTHLQLTGEARADAHERSHFADNDKHACAETHTYAINTGRVLRLYRKHSKP